MKKSFYDWCIENNKQNFLKEWDYNKNNLQGIFIDKISFGSGKNANWICKNNHEYIKTLDARTNSNSGCPFCESNKKQLLIGFNDLQTKNPELAKEWDYDKNLIKPSEVLSTSSKKAWWICKNCGGSWESVIRQRTKVKRDCPYCAHVLPLKGKTDFESQCPELVKEWDYEKNNKLGLYPSMLTHRSGKKVWWKCQFCGHEWESKINNRTINKRNCPSCTMKTTSFGEQSLYYYIKQIFPDAKNRYRNLGVELDIFIPSINTGIEFDGYFWHNSQESLLREKKKYIICKQKNIKLIRIRDSKSNFSHDTCDSAMIIDNLKDSKQLESVIRLLLQELDPESNKFTRTNPKQQWSTIDNIINVDNDRFNILENKYLMEEKNSFIYKYPELLKEWHYERNKTLNPRAFTKSSTMNVWWKCSKCNHEWQAKIVNRTAGYNNCPICSNKLLKEGYNDFATLYPNLLNEWNYQKNNILPNKILMKTEFKAWWKCKKCNYEWIASLGERTRKDKSSGCPQCKINNASIAKHLKAISRGTIEKTNPEILDEWDYDLNVILPSQITHGSNKRVWWKCKCCGYKWQSSPNNRIRKKSKCPKCHYEK